MALAVPGFGGFGYDTTNGDLLIWVKDVDRSAAAQSVVAQYLAVTQPARGGLAGPNPRVRIQRANFDYLELGSLRDRVNAALAAESGVWFVDITQLQNRVEIGVAAGNSERVGTVLDQSGIPRQAYQIITGQTALAFSDAYDPTDPTTFPPKVDPQPVDTALAYGAPFYLNSRHGLVAGGARMTFLGPGAPLGVPWLVEYGCSVGLWVKNASGETRMLTAGHCSDTLAKVDGRSYWQPGINNYDHTKIVTEVPFAIENLDPAWKSQIPSWIAYKWADALLAVPFTNHPQQPDFRHIFRPQFTHLDWYVPPAEPLIEINATNPKFNVVAAGDLGPEGQVISKVGYRTGWSSGYTISNCSDVVYGGATSLVRPKIRCQVRTTVPAWGGDSGGPFFRVLPGNDGTNVEFLGITHAILRDDHLSFLSSWSKLQDELGTLTIGP